MEHKICSFCVMDTTANEIFFDHQGRCNFCIDAEKKINEINLSKKNDIFNDLIDNIKLKGKNSEYDCICGVSGGLDSSYLIDILVKNNIRPLAVHFDNGWNSDLAIKNIYALLEKNNVELYTHVVDWNEFKSLQKSFFKSSLANLEIPTDHAIHSLLFNLAETKNIQYIIHGGNQVSESIMPKSWMESFYDQALIYDINNKFEKSPLTTFPTANYFDLLKKIYIKKIKYIGLLNYTDYNIDLSKKILKKNYNWEPYKHKHGESFFTNFFQSYILPKKFNIDKRKAHFSSLVVSQQMTRDQALYELNRNLYLENIDEDIRFFCSKLDLEISEFDYLMNSPRKNINFYKNDQTKFEKLEFISKFIKNYAKKID